MINPEQLRRLIKDTLEPLKLWSLEAQELLMLTAAKESRLGTYLYQLGGGPALGIFQMEPRTLLDLYENGISKNEHVAYLEDSGGITLGESHDLAGNLIYQIIAARLQYRRFSEPLPKVDWIHYEDCKFVNDMTVTAMAEYWKKYWNTELGAGTVREAEIAYKSQCRLRVDNG